MISFTTFFEENLDKKIESFLTNVADFLEKERSVDNANFKMHNIFYKRSKNRFRNLYLNNYKDSYNICNQDDMSDDELCIAVLKSGKNKGQLCNKSVYIDKYCKKHCKVEKEETITIKDVKEEDQVEEEKDEKKVEIINNKTTCQSEERNEKIKIVVDINKFGNFVFGDTGLVFNNEKKIVAKEGPNGEWCTLKEPDVELCKKYKLRYQVINHDRKLPESTKTITRNFNILTNEWDD
jgi:hypothetical protein